MLQKKSRDEIRKSVSQAYLLYNEYRSNKINNLPFKFWDVIVLTALDEEQKMAYELLIKGKQINKEIPSGVDYHVISDPVGPKIGCGGATMNVIFHLDKIYGEKLKTMFILIINAGGFSQRMPSSSALGKVFMSIPFGSPIWQIFDLKLACYLPFLANMKPGYFQTASDTIEVFDVPVFENCNDDSMYHFKNEGLTALAHPSTTKIGSSHGVFIIEEKSQISEQSFDELPTLFVNCSEVLQKPTIKVMEDKNAILKTRDQKEFVYTDSCFYFNHEFAQKLLDFYKLEKPLTCEIDGYGDFMQSLGPNASSNFIEDIRNVSTVTDSLKPTRMKLFNTLKGSKLSVIAFNKSEFYHLGTMNEYLENLSPSGSLGEIVGWKSISSSYYDKDISDVASDATIMETLATKKIVVESQAIVEHCEFNCEVKIGSKCIVSSCFLDRKYEGIQLNIPSNCMIHTVPIKTKDNNDNTVNYVTLIFNISDDLKKVYELPVDVKFFGKQLTNSCEFTDNTFSLWNCKLFPSANSMHLSVLSSVELIENMEKSDNGPMLMTNIEAPRKSRYSACDVMQAKDVLTLINYKNDLRKKITSFL